MLPRNPVLYIEIPGILVPVRSEVSLLDMNRSQVQQYTQEAQNAVGILFSSEINKVAYALAEARSDNYRALAAQQPLVKAKKTPLSTMERAIGRLDADIWQRPSFEILAEEIIDFEPEGRSPDFRLPIGKDVAVYKGWQLRDGELDLRGVDPIYVTLPKDMSPLTEDLRTVLGAPKGAEFSLDSYVSEYWMANPDKVLNAIYWHFQDNGIFMVRDPSRFGDKLDLAVPNGVLLGSRLSMDEIIQNFETMQAQSSLRRFPFDEEPRRRARAFARTFR